MAEQEDPRKSSNVPQKDGTKKAHDKKASCFKDGQRVIDYVLAVRPNKTQFIRKYIKNMQALGLQFEVASGRTIYMKFINVHMPDAALNHFSQMYEIGGQEHVEFDVPKYASPFKTPVSSMPRKKQGEFSSAERIMITNKVLESTKYGDDEKEYGMSKLIRLKYIEDAYPLHDGPWTDEMDPKNTDIELSTDRHLLFTYVANMDMWYKELPLDLIFRYFGPEVAFYFAWLEYFNMMLLVPAIIGSFQFLLSLHQAAFNDLYPVSEICEAPETMMVCPICNSNCEFPKFIHACELAVWSYVFDNSSTVLFAVLMSFWCNKTFFILIHLSIVKL